jgi:hypothetical protein
MSNELLAQFNRTGRAGKFRFSGELENVIFGQYRLFLIAIVSFVDSQE